MSIHPSDIKDDEIRIISSCIVPVEPTPQKEPQKPEKPGKKWRIFGAIILAVSLLVLLIVTCILLNQGESDEVEDNPIVVEKLREGTDTVAVINVASKATVEITDTIINSNGFTIFAPLNTTPRLHVGADIFNDTTAVLAVQAADVRGDNGEIGGAFVLDGELISKGQAKAGYCAIIDGKINIGVATSTPLLEQALESGGYFFRQYPLVVGGQIVENKPKGRALRKALALLNGNFVVVISRDKLSFHDFSESLVAMGVTDAIYLIGSAANGFVKDAQGNRIEFGNVEITPAPNVNYIYWM